MEACLMRFIFVLFMVCGVAQGAFAHSCEGQQVVLHDFHPQNAYALHCIKKSRPYARVKKPRVLNQMAYINPPAAQIFNHPAKGMKHPRHESLHLVNGTPPRRLVYPYIELREREARPEWPLR
jgi:hypothetical protein